MAVVQGIKEKVHSPIYDAIRVPPEEQLGDVERSNILRFFMNVQNKTKLETNLQSSSLLPHYNTFEARAMRVVVSDLPPEFNADIKEIKISDEGFDVADDDDNLIDAEGNVEGDSGFVEANAVAADFELPLSRAVELLREAHESEDGYASLPVDEEGVTLDFAGDAPTVPEVNEDAVIDAGGVVWLSEADLRSYIDDLEEKKRPLREQVIPNNGAGSILAKLIYNTVTTFYVGEKIMIQMPTWFFPAGAGPYSESGKATTHGEPSPTATFRFAEPIYIDKQQNFRVELEIPNSDVMKELQRIYGPLFIWVVLDGYMTRDVQ